MAITWDEARTKVRGDLWRPGVSGLPDDVCDRALHAALKLIEAERRWLWLENISDTVVLVDDAAVIDPPVVSDDRDDGRIDDALSVLSLGRIRALVTQSVPGWPGAYAFNGGKIYLDTAATAGCSLEIIGTVKTPDDITAAIDAGDTNPTLQLHQTIVIAGAAAWAATTYLKNDAEGMRQQQAFDRGLDRLNQEEDDARSDNYGGLIVPDTGYRDMAGYSSGGGNYR